MTPPNTCLIISVGGILHPQHVLPTDVLLNVELARQLYPLGYDSWFWVIARLAELECHCLVYHEIIDIRIQGKHQPSPPKKWMKGKNDVQLSAVIEHFGMNIADLASKYTSHIVVANSTP